MPTIKQMRAIRAEAMERQAAGGLTANTAAGGLLMQRALPMVAERISEGLKASAKKRGLRPAWLHTLSQIRPEVTALLGLRSTLDALAQGPQKRTSVARRVGQLLMDEAALRAKAKESPRMKGLIQKLAEAKKGGKKKQQLARRLFLQTESRRMTEQVIVGSHVLQTIYETLPLFTETVEFQPRSAGAGGGVREVTLLRISPDVVEWAAKFSKDLPLLRPVFLPMDTEPADWTSAVGGGYGPDSGSGNKLLLNCLPEQEDAAQGGVYMDACNAAQRTPWAINTDVLEIFRTLWAQGSTEAGLPSRDRKPYETQPPGLDEVELRRWKRAVVRRIDAESSRYSEVLAYSKRLWIANQLAQQPRFWYPYALDFRGRMYPRAAYLTPQGSDLERGLLQFANGRPIGSDEAARWLRIHLANCYGVDKVSLDARIQWVDDNDRQILDSAEDPLTNRWWTTAENPWQFLAAILDYWKFRQDGLAHVSRIPIGMDGSNNGLQLYALLTGDAKIARATNVLPTPEPQDIYREVAARATERLRALARGASPVSAGISWILRELYPDGLPRSLAKRPVMTLAYGVTGFSARRYVVDSFRADCEKAGKSLPDGIDQYAVLTALGDAVWHEVSKGVESAMKCMDWITDLGRRVAEKEEALRWTTPSGFPACQYYEKERRTKIKTMCGVQCCVCLHIRLRVSSGELAVSRMEVAAAPNFIHSLDAAIMAETVGLCYRDGVSDFALVHDSFAVPAGDAPRLAGAIREAIIKVFRTDPLGSFAESVESILGETVERFVPLAEFETNVVRDSTYIFA